MHIKYAFNDQNNTIPIRNLNKARGASIESYRTRTLVITRRIDVQARGSLLLPFEINCMSLHEQLGNPHSHCHWLLPAGTSGAYSFIKAPIHGTESGRLCWPWTCESRCFGLILHLWEAVHMFIWISRVCNDVHNHHIASSLINYSPMELWWASTFPAYRRLGVESSLNSVKFKPIKYRFMKCVSPVLRF